MTTLEYKLLGLLARQPMSGYDLASHLKQRFVPFGPISHTQIYPALPFTEPYLLKKGHRLQISLQNNNTSTGFDNMFLTIRGVRLCAY